MITESLLSQIESGRQGKNHGFKMGLDKLESVIDGVCKQTYTLIFSNSGAGKTNFALYAYVYRPLMEHLDDDKYRIWYASLEMNSDMIFGKLLSMYIFEKYKKVISLKELLSRKKDYILSDEDFKIVLECQDWLKKIEKKIIIYDKTLNAENLYAMLNKELEKIGKFSETEHRKIYTPNDPDLIFAVVIDHIGLCKPNKGRSLKQEIDLVSQYLLTLRNICGISPIVIQQANRDQGSTERFKQARQGFTLNDTKDSGGPVQDSEIVISIYNPFRDKLNSYRGYDVKTLGQAFRIISVLKSRYGDSDIEIGCNFFGACNWWVELPLPDAIYDYERYTTIDYLIDDKPPTVQKVENDDFNFTL